MQKPTVLRILTAAVSILLPALAAVAQDSRPAEPAAGATPLDVAELRQQLARSLAAEGDKLLAAGDAAAAARKFREAAGLAIETPPSPEAARTARRQAIIDSYAAKLRADAKRLQKDGRMLAAYRRAVLALRIESLDEETREIAVACQRAAVAEWKAKWAKLLGDRPLQVSFDRFTVDANSDGSPADQAAWKALRQAAPKMSFQATKFEDVIQRFGDLSKVNIYVRWRALEEVGIMRGTPVSLNLKELPLETALTVLLDEVSGAVGRDDRLNYVVRDGVLRISTNDDLDRDTFTTTYGLRELLEPFGPGPLPNIPSYDASLWECAPCSDDYSRLIVAQNIIYLLQRTVAPATWIEGGPTNGSVAYAGGILVINQTDRNHREIRRILRLLQWANSPAEKAARLLPTAATTPAESKAAQLLREKLAGNVPKINFENTKLEDVVEFLGDVTQCTVRANWRAMEEVGIMKNTPVDTRLSNVTLRTALDILLADVSGPVARNDRLGWVQWNGVLTISTNADLDRSTYIEVYEIRDLLAHEFAEAVLERGNPIRDLLGIWNEDETIFGRGDDDSDDVLGSGGCSDVGGSEEDWRKAADDLIVVLEKTIDPESWIEGSPTSGHISFLAGVLIINQTPQNHERIAELLARFRKSLLGKPAEEGKQ